MSSISLASLLEQIRFAHSYTGLLLQSTPAADWSRIPTAGVSHVAWQLGHLASAGYRLALERQRGRKPEDESGLISEGFIALFLRESVPDPDQGRYPSAEALRAVYDHV